MTTGEKIASVRKINEMSQDNFAKILNVSRQSVSKWESDICLPETNKMLEMCKIFNVKLDWLLLDHADNIEIHKKMNLLEELQNDNKEINDKIEKDSKYISQYKNTLTYVFIGLAIVVALVFLITTGMVIYSNVKYHSFRNDDANVQQNNIYSLLDSQIWEGTSYDYYNAMKKTHLYDHGAYRFNVEYVDFERQIVVINFIASANYYTDDTVVQCEIIGNDNKIVVNSDLVEISENLFQGKIEVPFCDELKISAIISSNSENFVEVVDDVYEIKEYCNDIFTTRYSRESNYKDNYFENFKICIYINNDEVDSNLDVKDMELSYVYNGKPLNEADVPCNFNYEITYDEDRGEFIIQIPKLIFLVDETQTGILDFYLTFNQSDDLTYTQKILTLTSKYFNGEIRIDTNHYN